MSNVLAELFAVIESRKQQDPSESYVASLHNKGLNKILEKVGEEATETIIAAKDCSLAIDNQELNDVTNVNKVELVKEVADLWFHTMVMLSHLEIDQQDVQRELASRFGTSGIAEKRNRTQSSVSKSNTQSKD